MDTKRSETWFFVALLAVTIFLSWLILAPFVSALVLASALAFLFRPLYRKLQSTLRYESAAALSTILVVVLIVFIPIGFFTTRIFGEASVLYISLTSHGGFDIGASLTNFLRAHFAIENVNLANLSLSFNNYAQQALTWLIQNLGSFFSQAAQIFFTVFLSLFGLFYALKDGEHLKKWMLDTIPLSPEYIEGILHEMEAVGKSVIQGTLVGSIIQGIIVGVGFFLFHIPDPTFWGALVVPVSIIPVVGTWLVVIPAIAYLFVTGQTAFGIGLVLWSLVLINVAYNVLAPQLMRHGADIHPLLMLLSVLGGIALFGPIGFLMGPLVIALLLSLLKIYTKLVVKRA